MNFEILVLLQFSVLLNIFGIIEHFRYSLFDTDYLTFSILPNISDIFTEHSRYFYQTFSVCSVILKMLRNQYQKVDTGNVQ